MIGEVYRLMKFTKIALALLMMVVVISDVQATSSASAVLTINVTYIPKSCDIQVPSSYNLGVLTPGKREHGNMEITWYCEGDIPIKTALKAEIVNGYAEDDNKVRLMIANQPSGAVLSLKEKDTPIALTGNNFCSDLTEDLGMRSCMITPETEVEPNGPFGLASATLKFTVVYP
ncbi:F18 fimbrial protein FedE [Escherichia coli]|nr:F18 fimbrial protein FedE [Escherichia coli]EEY4480761.1 F18 fimbrial protein FedE [Escherichia coli O8]EFE2152858.1 F18 fimbrial protein FedE [Escherichia coli O8:H28]EEQ4333700.1 F18 fimbrial protein FedE [Escherichia coli]EEQ7706534.1 F18 fimbrial protein FedE [Escherichia coli]